MIRKSMPSDLIRGWVPVFPRDKREAFARRSCSNKKMERDDDSKKSHHARSLRAGAHSTLHGVVFAILRPDPYGLKNAGSLTALIMVSTMSAAPWSSRSSSSSHILRKLARSGAFSEGSRSIRVRAMQKAMASAPIRACSIVGLLIVGSFSDFDV